MTAAEIAAIRARCEAATHGPWEVGIEPNYPCSDERRVQTAWIHGQLRGKHEITSLGVGLGQRRHTVEIDQADAAFIAHARTDIPALLAELDRLQGGADSQGENMSDSGRTMESKHVSEWTLLEHYNRLRMELAWATHPDIRKTGVMMPVSELAALADRIKEVLPPAETGPAETP